MEVLTKTVSATSVCSASDGGYGTALTASTATERSCDFFADEGLKKSRRCSASIAYAIGLPEQRCLRDRHRGGGGSAGSGVGREGDRDEAIGDPLLSIQETEKREAEPRVVGERDHGEMVPRWGDGDL